MVIDQYILAALKSAKLELQENSKITQDLVTRLQIQHKWPRKELPHPVLSLESKVDIVNVAPNVGFSGVLDYLISFIRESEVCEYLPLGFIFIVPGTYVDLNPVQLTCQEDT